MDMVRWLASNIVVQVAWGLGVLVFLLGLIFGGGTHAEEHSAKKSPAVVAEMAPVKVKDTIVVTDATAVNVKETVEPVQALVGASVTGNVVAKENSLDVNDIAAQSSDDLLTMAREAYWNNGLAEAADLYGILIEREPAIIEHKGELGNVLWRQGYPKKAAELYAEIAEPMIEQGKGERVSNMVGFIGLFFPDRATSIRELLAK